MTGSIGQALLWAALGCGFTWLMTTLGSAMVFFVRRDSPSAHRIFLGFAAGVMIAASVWSLLNPAIEQAEELGQVGWVPAAGGFLLGVGFLLALDTFLPHLHAGSDEPEGVKTSWKRTTLLVSAVTLHNVPEGMSVGLLFAMAAQTPGAAGDAYLGMAMALAVGMGLQNFPEGAAVSLPLAREGMSRVRAFVLGSLSGIVEPLFGIGVVLDHPVHAVDARLRGGRHDLRRRRGAHPRGEPRRALERRHAGRGRGFRDHDGLGRRPRLDARATPAPVV